MTREEIEEKREVLRATISIPDILSRYGVQVRHGRCKAICHEGKNYTAKISHDLYYCFKCNKRMDIFDITMHFNNCDFWTAFELLGGTEKPSFTAQREAKAALKERQDRIIKAKKEKAELKRIRAYITAYRQLIDTVDPFTDLWCYAQNQLQLELYHLEYMTQQGER